MAAEPLSDRASLVWFFLLTFGLTWGLAAMFLLAPETLTRRFGPLDLTSPFFILAVYAPGIAGVTMVGVMHGRSGLRRYLGRLGRVRVHWLWYAWLALGIPLLMIFGAALKGTAAPPVMAGLGGAVLLAAVIGPMEELGWRGFALPLLQRHLSPLTAGLTLGVVWGIWHVPAFLIGTTPQSGWAFLPYLVAVIAVSVIMTGLYNASRGSVLLAMLMHFQLNNPVWPDSQPYDAVLFTLAALVICVLGRRGAYAAGNAVRDVV